MRTFSVCWLLAVLLLAGLAQAQPVPSPSPSPAASPEALASPAPSPSPVVFDLPPLVRPDWGDNWWSEPYLFEVASTGKVSGDERARRILARVADVAERGDWDGLYNLPEAEVDQSLGTTVVRVGKDVLVTVLPEDLPEYAQRLSPERQKLVEHQVAERWAAVLGDEVKARVAVRTREIRWLGISLGVGALVVAILLNGLITWVARRYFKTPLWSLRALVWLVWLVVMLSVVPELQGLRRIVQTGFLNPLWLLLTASLGSALTLQLFRVGFHRYLRSLARHRGASARAEQRAESLEGAAYFAARLAVFVGAVFYTVTGLGIDASSLLAGAGLLGAAMTLVSQDLIRDLLAGMFILLEDQFVVGDWIEAGSIAGTVEAFHLRATRVRTIEGTACLVPNSELRSVRNCSLDWSQVDFEVKVAMGADPEQALEILVDETRALIADRPDQALGDPEVLGFERLGPDGISLRLLVRTRPLQQWAFRRELNRRVHARFRKEGIDLAGLRRTLRVEGYPPPPAS